MSWVRAAWILVVVCACGGSPPPEPVAPAPVQREPEPEPEPPPFEDTIAPIMASLVAGEHSVGEWVDRSNGLIHVMWASDASGQDPRVDESGMIRVAERLCGAELDAFLVFLDRDLRNRADALIDCVEQTCTHPAAVEYDLAGRYRFVPGETPRLESVARLETGVTEEALAQGEAYLSAQLTRLAGGGCGE